MIFEERRRQGKKHWEAPPHSLLATTKSFMKQMTCHCSETRCLLSCFVVNCVLVVQAHTQMISTGGSILFEKLYSIANLQIEVRYAPPTKRDIIHLWSVRLYLTFSLQWLQLIFGPDDPLSIELQATCRYVVKIFQEKNNNKRILKNIVTLLLTRYLIWKHCFTLTKRKL